ncbi:MAG: PHB depolymerase family esterase [Cyanobacteriota/Melainabacteria group bacterium]
MPDPLEDRGYSPENYIGNNFNSHESNNLYSSLNMNDFGSIQSYNSSAYELPTLSVGGFESYGLQDDVYELPTLYVDGGGSSNSWNTGNDWNVFPDPYFFEDVYYWPGYQGGSEGGGGGGEVPDRTTETPPETDNTPPDQTSDLKPGETTVRTMEINGQTREYRVHLPEGYDGSKDTPLLMVYHGVNSNAEEMEQRSQLSERADKEGFIVVYMDGNPDNGLHSWNNGQLAFSKADDIGFTRNVMDQMSSELKVDSSQVFAVGFSQGESMVHRLANDPSMAGKFAAIGVAGGWMTGRESVNGDAANPNGDDLSIITIKSNDDPISPARGRFNYWFANMKPESYDENYYRQRNEIADPASRQVVRDAEGNVVRYESSSVDPESGARVTSVRLTDERHVWPGSDGTVHPENNATDMILDFFGLSDGEINPSLPVTYSDYGGSIEPPKAERNNNRGPRR